MKHHLSIVYFAVIGIKKRKTTTRIHQVVIKTDGSGRSVAETKSESPAGMMINKVFANQALNVFVFNISCAQTLATVSKDVLI